MQPLWKLMIVLLPPPVAKKGISLVWKKLGQNILRRYWNKVVLLFKRCNIKIIIPNIRNISELKNHSFKRGKKLKMLDDKHYVLVLILAALSVKRCLLQVRIYTTKSSVNLQLLFLKIACFTYNTRKNKCNFE
jgi:hypothetical protein